MFLISNVFRSFLFFLYWYTSLRIFWSYFFTIASPIVFYFHFNFQSLSACMVLLVTIDRYIAACLPYMQHLRSMKRMRIAVWILVIGIALLSLTGNIYEMTGTIKSRQYSYCVNYTKYYFSNESGVSQLLLYLNAASIAINRVPPTLSLVVLIVLNILLIIRLRQQKNLHRSSSSHSDRKQDNKMLVMTVVVVLVFCVCTVPITIRDFIIMTSQYTKKIIIPVRVDYHWFYLGFDLLAVNSSVNFLIYCLVWTKFRGLISNLWR